MPLVPHVTLEDFDKWAIEFVGQISPLGKNTCERYIIIVTDYLIRWAEVKPVKDYNKKTTAKFIFKYILSRFRCLKILMRNHGTHFLNKTIEALIEEFRVYHHKSTPYHRQEKRIVDFNNILENALTKLAM